MMEQHTPETNQTQPPSLAELHRILEDEIRQHEGISNVLNRKKSALVMSKPQLLAQIDKELMAYSRKAHQLEQRRQAIMAELGQPNATLSQLIDRMEPTQARAFRPTRERLLNAVQQAGQLNQENRGLLDLSLSWIQETVELIAGALTPEATSYTAQGGKKKGGGETPPSLMQSTINHSA